MNYFLILIFLLCIGCQTDPSSSTTEFSGNAMTIDYKILIGSSLNESQKKHIDQIIHSIFIEVNDIYNRWNPESELSHFNLAPANQKIPLSPKLAKLLTLTNEMVLLTQSRFDPTVEPLYQFWKAKLEKGEMPTQAEIDALSPAIGWNNIHFEKGYLWKDHDQTRLDLGGIAKGYCVDLLVEKLNANNFLNVFVEWGGEIRASGNHPSKRPWRIFISRLGDTDPAHAIDTVNLNNQAIATSGDYLQKWTVASTKQTFYHIINPKTLRPLESTAKSIASASVLAPTCAFADGLATAAMIFDSVDEAKVWAESIQEKFPQTKFWIISR